MSSQGYIQITEIMNESLGTSMLSDPGFGDTLQYFIDTCTNVLPGPSVVNMLIFELLMKNDNATKVDEVSVFLQNLLMSIPSNNDKFIYDYKAAILDETDTFPDLWSILVHLIESSFCHHGIRQHKSCYKLELVCYPVCDFLIHFYIAFILKFLSLKRDLFGSAYHRKSNDLMRWINEMYKFNIEVCNCFPERKNFQMVEILKDLHNLLDQAINEEIMLNASCSAAVALNHTYLFDTILQLFTICKDVFANYGTFVQFLNFCKLPYLSASICHNMLYKITETKRLPVGNLTALTLKELIRCFFFICLPSQERRSQTPVFSVKKRSTCLKKQSFMEKVRKIHVQSLLMGDTQMHKMCRYNLMGDLLDLLLTRKNMNLNAVNAAGQTPLHVACISSNFMCAKFLLDPLIGKTHKPLDISAVDKQNCTPFHYAVMADDTDIVQLLLQQGGEETLNKEIYNFKPHEYCVSEDMASILKNHFPDVFLKTDDDYTTEEFKISTIHRKEDYLIYLYSLHYLLCTYFDIFDLYNLRDKVCSVNQHDGISCGHFSSTVKGICIEDYSVIHSLPKSIEQLITCVQHDALEIGIDVKSQVRVLRLFSENISTG